MDSDWLSKFYSIYITAAVNIVNRRSLTIELYCRNETKPVLYKLYINNKTECLVIKGGVAYVAILRCLKEELVEL